jgi:O-antigen/teichoic acid export membrane protein
VMPPAYWPATDAVAPLALASVGAGAYTIFIVGLNVTKRMRLTAPLAMLGGAIAIGLYFLLIPPYSYRGAAWATALAFASLALLVLAVGQRIYPVPWQWRRILLAVGLTVGLALTSLAVDHGLGIAVSIPVRLAITLAYPAALFALGFFPRDDIASAQGRLRALLRR